ncbi:hypothetical protein [Bradyrhizobium ottawaense]|uniref:hypothetical protein n=1 Tax=Bradyrhizobium ottawaense TaxID=931866 RepID=UPI003FA135C0
MCKARQCETGSHVSEWLTHRVTAAEVSPAQLPLSLDLSQKVSASSAFHRPMPGTDKQTEDKEAKPSRLYEARRVIEEYVNELREIIRKLRQKMN